jgi:hypothetical protein
MNKLLYPFFLGILLCGQSYSYTLTPLLEQKGVYVGGLVAVSDTHPSQTDASNTITSAALKGQSSATRIYIGYKKSEQLSEEVGFSLLNKTQYKEISAAGITGSVDMSYDTYILDFITRGTVPLITGINLDVMAGLALVRRFNYSGETGGLSFRDNFTTPIITGVVGAGITYPINNQLDFKATYYQYIRRSNLNRITFVGAGLEYHFV